jgi:hypothetical protein
MPNHRSEHRVAPPPMQEGHSAKYDPASPGWKLAALYEISPVAQFFDKARKFEEIVAVVGIAHNHKPTVRRGNPAH